MNALVFGATGAIGSATVAKLAAGGMKVITTSRTPGSADICVDPGADLATLAALDGHGPFAAVVWAQGSNVNDCAQAVEAESFNAVIESNVTFVVATLGHLLRHECLAPRSSLVVVSSIWEPIGRPGKFSYTVSKAAIGGVVRAAAADLSSSGHRINAVLPGATDTPMTRSMLDPAQIDAVAGGTGFNRLVSLEEVAATIAWLCGEESTGISGQSLAVDLGFSHVRTL